MAVLTPWLVMRIVGAEGAIAAGSVLQKLGHKVLLPLRAGQVLRGLPAAPEALKARKKGLSRLSESLLLGRVEEVHRRGNT